MTRHDIFFGHHDDSFIKFTTLYKNTSLPLIQCCKITVKDFPKQTTTLVGAEGPCMRGRVKWICTTKKWGLNGRWVNTFDAYCSYGILRILNFDWFTGNGEWAHIPLTTNMLTVRVFFAMTVADFEGFL